MNRVRRSAEMQDGTHILQARVLQAANDRQPLAIIGGGSKRFYGRRINGEPVSTSVHTGILSYEPTELVLTARAGTPMTEIEEALASRGQMLACEPPHFGPGTTFGGMIAAGLSGPGRPFRAAVQDIVLGCTLLNGKGEVLRFGGKVMKNVAGYDISRLQVGAMGCLGILLDITVKVIPAPVAELTCAFEADRRSSHVLVNTLRGKGLPVTATSQAGTDELLVRFSAGAREIASLPDSLGKQSGGTPWRILDSNAGWQALKDQQAAFFQTDLPLWRLSLGVDADITQVCDDPSRLLSEWGGCLHWLQTTADPSALFGFAAARGGQATLFRGQEETDDVFQPLPAVLQRWHQDLKQAFDPAGILNPGRLYAGL